MAVKKLYRSRDEVMIAGICSGIAKYLDIDPTIVRLVFVLLFFVGAGGLWIYLILWIIMPVEPKVSATGIMEVPSKPVEASIEPVKVEPVTEVIRPEKAVGIAKGSARKTIKPTVVKAPSRPEKSEKVEKPKG